MQPYEKPKREFAKIASGSNGCRKKAMASINRDQLLGFRFNRQKPLLSYFVDFIVQKQS